MFDRVVGIDRKRQTIAKGKTSQPDYLREFVAADKWAGGMVRGVAVKAGARAKDRVSSFASIDCTEETLAQAFNRWKKHGKGYYAGKKRTKWAQDGLNAVIRGIRMKTTEDPHHQFCLENPAWSALRFDKAMKKNFGEGIVVKPCAYGERMSGKEYRFWMTPDALHEFRFQDRGPGRRRRKVKVQGLLSLWDDSSRRVAEFHTMERMILLLGCVAAFTTAQGLHSDGPEPAEHHAWHHADPPAELAFNLAVTNINVAKLDVANAIEEAARFEESKARWQKKVDEVLGEVEQPPEATNNLEATNHATNTLLLADYQKALTMAAGEATAAQQRQRNHDQRLERAIATAMALLTIPCDAISHGSMNNAMQKCDATGHSPSHAEFILGI